MEVYYIMNIYVLVYCSKFGSDNYKDILCACKERDQAYQSALEANVHLLETSDYCCQESFDYTNCNCQQLDPEHQHLDRVRQLKTPGDPKEILDAWVNGFIDPRTDEPLDGAIFICVEQIELI